MHSNLTSNPLQNTRVFVTPLNTSVPLGSVCKHRVTCSQSELSDRGVILEPMYPIEGLILEPMYSVEGVLLLKVGVIVIFDAFAINVI